ncbi:MAG: GHMP kinase [Lentisphaeria bacterium]
MLLNATSFARAGIIGNPSDGYFGKTLSCAFENYSATVVLYETPELQFLPGDVDDAVFTDLDHLMREVRLFGYYGGIRLLKAVTKLFVDHCRECAIPLPRRNFTARYTSTIPRLVGLSGSSAIVTAMLKCLMKFYEVQIPLEQAATLCLNAEKHELGIQCGLQDRVIQMYEGVVFMDFNRSLVESRGYGVYTPMNPALLPDLYIAFDPQRAEISGVYHQKLRVLFEEKQPDVVAAMGEFADLAQRLYEVLLAGRLTEAPALINANFDLRDRIFHVAEANRHMVMTARRTGCSAKFAGSGGAIVGTYEDDAQFDRLSAAMAAIGCSTFKPIIGRGQWHPDGVVPAGASRTACPPSRG